MKYRNKKYLCLAALAPFFFITFLYEIIPLVMVMAKSFASDEGAAGLTLENYSTVFSKLLYQKAVINSLKISLKSSLIGIVIAFLGARAAQQQGGRLKHIFTVVLNMVSNFAGIPLAFAFMILLGNAGLVANIGKGMGIEALQNFNLYTMDGLTLIYAYFQIPLSTLLLLPAFAGIRKEWSEACMLLGGGSGVFWSKVGIPVLMPSILGTFNVMFANAVSAYATAYAIMMNNVSLLPIQIAGCFTGEVKIKEGLGGALSVVMMGIMVIMILITNGISRRYQKGAGK